MSAWYFVLPCRIILYAIFFHCMWILHIKDIRYFGEWKLIKPCALPDTSKIWYVWRLRITITFCAWKRTNCYSIVNTWMISHTEYPNSNWWYIPWRPKPTLNHHDTWICLSTEHRSGNLSQKGSIPSQFQWFTCPAPNKIASWFIFCPKCRLKRQFGLTNQR